MRIRSRLLILVFAILIPSVLGAALAIYYVYAEQQKSYRESIQELTNAMSLTLDKEMSGRISILQTLANAPSLTANDVPTFYRYALEVASHADAVVILSDQAGHQVFNTRVALGTENLPSINTSLLTLRQQHGPHVPLVSDVYYAPLGKNHSFAIQVPVVREGRILYYLQMSSFVRNLQRLFEQQKMPSGWIATILDRQGMVAARSQEADKFVGAIADASLRTKIAASPTGTNEGTTLNGIPVTAFYSRTPTFNWSVVVSVPSETLLRPARNAAALVAAIALALLGLGMAAALVTARKTAKSMEELRMAAAALGQGNTIAGLASGVTEIDAVSKEMAHASEHIRNAKIELEHRVADAVATAERSQKALVQSQKLEALGRLTGGIAHDFNNVMQTLTTGLQLLLFTVTEPRLKATIEVCERAVERAVELTRQLMVFGRVQDAHLAVVDLVRQVEEIKPLLVGGLRNNIELRFDVGPDLWPVSIDPSQFDLAMLNVVINARDAMPDGGSIVIRMHNFPLAESMGELVAGDYVQISVIDTGQGMRQEVLSKALDPFFTTKPLGKGSGMGLPQAYGFAKQSAGNLTLHSKPGEGTTVIFYLPRAHGAVEPSPGPHKTAMPRSLETGSRLLFVEDDPLVATVVIPALKEAGFEVQEAKNGEDALAKIKRDGPFDVVFSDVVMPGPVSGIDLAEYITRHDSRTRVVLATGYSDQRINLRGVEILAKPYDVQEAVEILSRTQSD
ncbi:hybrid sensor histidine kinase/response regulator [Noviherbaspirillum massiliense]|uniref:hybrid sensor histidine kinase/response regulator n=1 Tax=Noviherbaspirillum massiliense TaxID=1465823 RepID=UPI000304F674|nr:ATP-binding protein [Noviherbaspirillum massiliense]